MSITRLITYPASGPITYPANSSPIYRGGSPLSTTIESLQNVAALRAATGLPSNQVIELKGYNSAGDGGGTFLWIDSSDTTSTDNGGSVFVTADGKRAKPLTTSTMRAAQYGIFPGSDCTTLMQAGFDDNATWGRFVIDIPGQYIIGRTLYNAAFGVWINNATDVFIEIAEGVELYSTEDISSYGYSILMFSNPSNVHIYGKGTIAASFTGEPTARRDCHMINFDGSSTDLKNCSVKGITLNPRHSTNNAYCALYGVLAVGNTDSGSNSRGETFVAEDLFFPQSH